MAAPAEVWVTCAELARALGLSQRHVRRVIRDRGVDFIVPGKRAWRISLISLRDVLGDEIADRCLRRAA